MSGGNYDEEIKRAQENFRIISELKEKLEILTEHVGSRKEALDEEIEETLHEAVANARDCLERIQENIEPKLEKVIREKLGEIDKKMDVWKRDGLDAVRKELEAAMPDVSKKVLWDLDQVIVEKVKLVKDDIMKSVGEEVRSGIESALADFKVSAEKESKRVRILSLTSLGISLSLLLAVAWFAFR